MCIRNKGISSISANIDAVRDIQHEVKRVEQQLILDSVRDGRDGRGSRDR
jgi:pyruvate,water dikinase